MVEVSRVLSDCAPSVERLDVGRLVALVARRRRTRRRTVGLVACSAVLVAAGGLVAARPARGPDQSVTAGPPGVRATQSGLATWSVPGVRGLAWSAGRLWAVGAASGGGGYVERLDPGTGVVEQPVRTSAPIQRAAGGKGILWAVGDGSGTAAGTLVALDPGTGKVLATLDLAATVRVGGIAVSGTQALVTDTPHDRVLRARVVNGSITADWLAVRDRPTDIVAGPSTGVWLREAGASTIARIDPSRGRVLEREPWPGRLLAPVPAPGSGIWATGTPTGPLVQLAPDRLADGVSVALGVRIQAHPSSISADGGGVWVLDRRRLARYGPGGDEMAGSRLTRSGLSGVVGEPGTAWFIAARGVVGRWSP